MDWLSIVSHRLRGCGLVDRDHVYRSDMRMPTRDHVDLAGIVWDRLVGEGKEEEAGEVVPRCRTT